MKVYLDGQEIALPGGADAPSVLSAVRGQVAKDGRVITGLRVDDVEMDDEAFLNLTGGMAAHFVSQPVRDLVRESLDDALGYAPRLTKGLEEIALHFDRNELATAESGLADAAEGLDWLLRVFHHCSALLAVGGEADDAGLAKLKESLAAAVERLGSLHEERLYPQMALAIRQDLLPKVNELAAHVRSLRSLVTSAQ
ncbi:MAG: hypothetical protein LBO82_08195 [Synergistaceae bacterium]|jgi:hypothetical protein|nr:hypothetical protein [Synergistaceae bacterium]